MEKTKINALEEFKCALSNMHYRRAERLARSLETPLVCYYTTHHIDYLIANNQVETARKVCDILGRNLIIYLEDRLK